ncbi:M3 family metallopeptidase [Cellulomonas soli]|uniref:Peptidyl-dipeptidase Dcp n=1 Tax=Cellulomonas soli TaxID=931535 RepID=A0A512PH89_9CELL|nr:M3 family metallopeptidase [Cellulomonas soli]NYI60840.1 peptidyl-dipeptidase Dcp [Cellulomonas soli]GEP70576.1 peptidyl-dipeptidase Dcp [Cellulomonas soli]
MTSIAAGAPVPLDPTNPFAQPSTLPYGLPDFTAIREEHYLPALLAGMAEQRAQVEAVASDPSPATVENTLEALERSGRLLHRAATAFFNQSSSDATPGLEDIEEQVAPLLAAHDDAIHLDARLFARLESLQQQVAAGELELPADTAWLLHRQHTAFVRAGVGLDGAAQDRLRELNGQITSLEAAFGRKLLAGANAAAVLVTDPAELDGLPDDARAAAAQAAADRGHAGAWLIELQLPTQQGPLVQLRDRGLRERVLRASAGRGATGDEHDTRATILELVRLRAERAILLGYEHHAAYVAADATARTAEAVEAILGRLAPVAVENARQEAVDLTQALEKDHPGATLEAWDWAFYAEQVRKERRSLDDALLRPYLELDRVLTEGVFRAAGLLYGLTFVEREDLVGYHPDVRVFEVFDADGSALGLFLGDYWTRESKRGGAWMNNLVDQSSLLDERPVVVNNLNIPKPPAGEPTLLAWDEVITMFHEFGHALHGLFSDVRYPSQSGTEVPRDFVEFPSQVNEMWAWDPTILRSYAVHHRTGEPMPAQWVDTLLAARQDGEGFATTEYLAAALLDQAWYRLAPQDVPTDVEDVLAFEAAALERAGVAFAPVPPRYRTTYFNHVFGGGYSAGYYSYIWSEVLDADTVTWFEENGGLLRANGDAFRAKLLSRGGSLDPMDAFRDLRGRDPRIDPLLVRRGLTGSQAG